MPHSCSYWVEKFRDDFFQRGRSETSWRTDYQRIFNRLPLTATLNAQVLHDLVIGTPVNSKTRKRACMACKAIAKFAGIKYDPSAYAGKYSQKSVQIRSIPNDEQIYGQWERLSNPGWKWFFGVLAAYGLRPHEAFKLDYERLRDGNPVVLVLPNTKTGSRLVWPFHPEWSEAFRLSSVCLPSICLDRPNIKLGESASRYFRDFNLPFHLYDVRHRWAIRTLEYGLDTGLSARQMGHSKDIHDRIYHRWIEESVQQRAYDALLNRGDRPRPP